MASSARGERGLPTVVAGEYLLDADKLPGLRQRIDDAAASDKALLDEAREDVRALASECRTIQPRDANYISLVASDGGHNRFEFNPFKLQVVRVVDSYGKELFFDVAPSSVDLLEVSRTHLDGGQPRTALGRLMADLKVADLPSLAPVLKPRPESASWFQVYREVCEWATLYELICYKEHAASTLILRDGLLRSKVFKDELFVDMYKLIKDAIERIRREHRRDVFLVGLAKRTEVAQHYQLAMSIENVFSSGRSCFAPVPQKMQEKVYRWGEYIRPPEDNQGGEPPKFNMGAMYFVRFGTSRGDPVWTADLLASQTSRAQEIFGCLLADARNGFPVPFYPKCLQQADHFAQVTDFDRDVLEDAMFRAVCAQVGSDGQQAVEEFRLNVDAASRRYG